MQGKAYRRARTRSTWVLDLLHRRRRDHGRRRLRLSRRALRIEAAVSWSRSPVSTVASMLCGMADSLTEIVLFRLLQGAFGAALVPLSQSVLFAINPPERQGRAMAMWGVAVMAGPVLGPVLGGWLTEDYSWRWVFYINLPIGMLAFLGMRFYLDETPRTPPSGSTGSALRRSASRSALCRSCSTAARRSTAPAPARSLLPRWWSRARRSICSWCTRSRRRSRSCGRRSSATAISRRARSSSRSWASPTTFARPAAALSAGPDRNYPVATAGPVMGPHGIGETMAAMALPSAG